MKWLFALILTFPLRAFAQPRSVVLQIDSLVFHESTYFCAGTEFVHMEVDEPFNDYEDSLLLTKHPSGRVSFSKNLALQNDSSVIWLTLDNSGGVLLIKNAYIYKKDIIHFETYNVYCDPFQDSLVDETFRLEVTSEGKSRSFNYETSSENIPVECFNFPPHLDRTLSRQYLVEIQFPGDRFFCRIEPIYAGNSSVTTYNGEGKTKLFKRLFTPSKRVQLYGNSAVKTYCCRAVLDLK